MELVPVRGKLTFTTEGWSNRSGSGLESFPPIVGGRCAATLRWKRRGTLAGCVGGDVSQLERAEGKQTERGNLESSATNTPAH